VIAARAATSLPTLVFPIPGSPVSSTSDPSPARARQHEIDPRQLGVPPEDVSHG
jgi:hypothetical protein